MLCRLKNLCLLSFCLFLSTPAHLWGQSDSTGPLVRIASKTFTESVILAEMAAQLVEQGGAQPEHRQGLGGTRVLWDALLNGAIDLYPEYTGTLIQEILAVEKIDGLESLHRVLSARGVKMTGSLGFDNNYAIGMRPETCQELGISRISDLRRHPQLIFGFSNEFMDRADGWPGLRRHYGLPQAQVQGLDHDLALRGLASSALDATDLYTTDADIQYYGFCILIDDLKYFSHYTAVILYRADLEDRLPQVVTVLNKLTGRINESDMIRLNLLVKKEKIPEQNSGIFIACALERT
jgi:osmoprotectant transport system permease protein